jgi:peptide/nickel transport system ATP-binding protein
MSTPVLALTDVDVRFPQRYGEIGVLDAVTARVAPGECVAVVGESGCGKSLLGLAAADLLPRGATRTGVVAFQGRDIARLGRRERRAIHGAGIGIVYQDALTSLNPGMTIGVQLRQVCRLGASATPVELLADVGLHDSARILGSRPGELSGGQRQRVMIAIALARDPALVIADEPTTALDVTVQAQIVELLRSLQRSRGFALVFISHDLALVSQFAQRIVVMYAGQVVEAGLTAEVLARPRHPYTRGLVGASLSLDARGARLTPIPGVVGQPTEFASGCRFRERCERADERCASRPAAVDVDGRSVACFHPVGAGERGERA